MNQSTGPEVSGLTNYNMTYGAVYIAQRLMYMANDLTFLFFLNNRRDCAQFYHSRPSLRQPNRLDPSPTLSTPQYVIK